jgi:hypothetical protein
MLARFDAITRQKDNALIDMPLIWRNFKLKGFILHQGGTGGGHYVYYGIHNKKWINFDDETVTENISNIDQLRQQGYLYYYEQDSTNPDKIDDKIDDIPFPQHEDVFKLEGNFAVYKGKVWFIQKRNDDGKFTILNADDTKKTVKGNELSMPTFDQIHDHVTVDILERQIIPRIQEYDAEYQKQKQIQIQPQTQKQTQIKPSLFSRTTNFLLGKKGGNSKTQKQHRKPKKRSITNKSSSDKNKSIKKHLKQ